MERLLNKIKAEKFTTEKEVVDPYYAYLEVEKLIDKCIPSPCLRKFRILQGKLEKLTAKNKKTDEKRLNLIREFEQDSGI